MENTTIQTTFTHFAMAGLGEPQTIYIPDAKHNSKLTNDTLARIYAN